MNIHQYWHRDFSFAFQCNKKPIRPATHSLNTEINISIFIEPSLPKPVQIFTGYIFDRIEKINRTRMFIGPPFNVFSQSEIKSFWSQDLFTQNNQSNGRFVIARHPQIISIHNLGIRLIRSEDRREGKDGGMLL